MKTNYLNSKIGRLFKTDFTKNVFILVGGTGAAQVFGFFLTPILTRLYSPTEFGIFGLFLLTLTVFELIPTLQFENVLIIEKDDEKVDEIAGSVILIAALISFVILILYLFTYKYLAFALKIQEISSWLLLIPFMILISSLKFVLLAWANREKRFKLMAKNRIILSLVTPTLSIIFYYYFKSAAGLILSHILSLLIVTFLLWYDVLIKSKRRLRYSLKISKYLLKEHRDFPLFSLPSRLINAFINQIPLLMLGTYADLKSVGQFNLSNRMLGLPITLISSAFTEVFRQKASHEYNENGNCEKLFLKSFFTLLGLSIILFGVFIFWGSSIFAIVFGDEWAQAGKYSAIMVPLFMLRFAVSPLTYIFIIAKKQKNDLFGHLLMLILITLSFPISNYFSDNSVSLIIGYTVSYCLVYIYYLIKSHKYSKGF